MSTDTYPAATNGVLAGLRVLDLSHHYSAAFAGVLLADLGADVTVVESPDGNVLRGMLPRKGDIPLWTSIVERNKANVSLKLSHPEARELFLQLVADFDVVIENFRPGTLERWGLGPEDLRAAGADVVMLRVSGYGQTGPRSPRPGFGGAAEAMSGLSQMTGPEGGAPILLSTAIADGVAGAFGIIGVLAALWQRANRRGPRDLGQGDVEVVDIALFEAMFRLIPTQVIEYDQCGTVAGRAGSVREHGVIRNIYRTKDDVHFCVSSVGERAVRRTLEAIGSVPLLTLLDEGVLGTGEKKVVQFIDDCDRALAQWASSLPFAEVEAGLDQSGVVHERVFTVADIVVDEHYLARNDVVTIEDPHLGQLRMPGIVPKFSGFDHQVRHAGRAIGADNAEIYGKRLGLSESRLGELRDAGVI
ncbi:CoA transferase [Aeromicrobium panaciterrae]|uniref:CaiB/BaiF CoA transferase family protein n=1 Tax=Aeromicrobium panaciterrae TaxID=363861 RepID=UPI0031DD5086